jgi:hypothetical protein
VNDLSRLLDDAVPEPRRALAAGDLARRARRRRTVRATALGAVAAASVVAGVAVAGGVAGGPGTVRPPVASGSTPAGSPSIAGTPGRPGAWPDPAGPSCKAGYPSSVETYAVAFDGTVTAVRPGDRVEIDLAVHHVFNGPSRATVTLTAARADLPADEASIVGLRVLAAVRDDLALTTCGFTRPWDAHDATAWYHAFEDRDTCALWSSRLYFPRYHEKDYTGMTVEAATTLAESRDLTVRLVGDGVQAITDDLRTDRVNLCNRDGVVTAALRF